MSEYVILPLPQGCGSLPLVKGEFDPATLPSPWNQLQEITIGRYSWDPQGYCPLVKARIGYNELGLHVLMYAQEPEIRAQETQIGGSICLDSCMEFFFRPDPDAPEYFNFEMNPLGVLHLGFGSGRHGRTVFSQIPEGMSITTSAVSEASFPGGYWAISYTVPITLIQKMLPHAKLEKGSILMGNLYKCGDRSKHPHWGTWLPVGTEKPDYHRPEFFGPMLLG